MDPKQFNQGVRAAGAVTALVLAFLYAVAAPTDYFRARIPFLLGSGGVGPLLFAVIVFEFAALLGVLVTTARSLGALTGASFVAVACTVAVHTGAAARFIPQFPESNARWIVFGLLATAALALLLRERRSSLRAAALDSTTAGRV